MACSVCGGDMIGDGYTSVRHCENMDPDSLRTDCELEPDAGPFECADCSNCADQGCPNQGKHGMCSDHTSDYV